MIKLILKGTEKTFTNAVGISILQNNNPKEKFRISICKITEQAVIQNWHETDKQWLCLHD